MTEWMMGTLSEGCSQHPVIFDWLTSALSCRLPPTPTPCAVFQGTSDLGPARQELAQSHTDRWHSRAQTRASWHQPQLGKEEGLVVAGGPRSVLRSPSP